MRRLAIVFVSCVVWHLGFCQTSYPVVDTGLCDCYDNVRCIKAPDSGQPYVGQDGCIVGMQPHYQDNGDGTISDLITGLMWEKSMGVKMTISEALAKAETLRTGGYDDWRIPTIKELYSLILFTGQSMGEAVIKPYIDTDFFIQPIGDTALGEREIDAQTWSATPCSGGVMGGVRAFFGVNFVDGRIKGYPVWKRGRENRMYFRMVRGNKEYGQNNFIDNGDGTISDLATGLMWQKSDDGQLYDWRGALSYADSLTLAGYTDWYLPNAKELQTIVAYEQPSAPAISPLFSCTLHDVDEGIKDYAYYWTSTTHLDGRNPYAKAVYVCFGHAWGRNPRTDELTDVHGMGAQRSDSKSGNRLDYPSYFGPQKDLQRVYNAVRCVRRIK